MASNTFNRADAIDEMIDLKSKIKKGVHQDIKGHVLASIDYGEDVDDAVNEAIRWATYEATSFLTRDSSGQKSARGVVDAIRAAVFAEFVSRIYCHDERRAFIKELGRLK